MELSFKIKEIPATGAPLRVRRPVPAALMAEALDGSGAEPARSKAELQLELFRDHDQVIVHGKLHGVTELPCSRCLEAARVRLDAAVDLVFTREGVEPSRASGDDATEDDLDQPDLFHHDGVKLALDEPVRELLISELPIAPLCEQGCRGLCATCGANQNTAEGRACGHAAVEPVRVGAFAVLGQRHADKIQSS